MAIYNGKTLQNMGVHNQQLMCIMHAHYITQHVLKPTRGARALDIFLSSQKYFVDNEIIQESLGCSGHNQLHVNIKIKSPKRFSTYFL